MFADAYEKATKFMAPVIVSVQRNAGDVQTGLGAFVFLNADGWIATAGHIVDMYNRMAAQPHRSIWWGNDGLQAAEMYVYPDADLALCRLDPVDASRLEAIPTFKTPGNLRPGTSLLKLGYPFHAPTATYDATADTFRLDPGAVPCPVFPIDGIFTRTAEIGTSPNGYPLKLIETSSPGLRGQSGGPTVDRDGVVWAIQSQTRSWALGIRPEVQQDGESVAEHQFLNTGLGIHPETLQAIFAKHSISVQWS
jgi:S1-C subfamily serine protease